MEHIYVHDGNAEEAIPKVIEYIKKGEHQKARTQAFEDCTAYWAGEVEKVLRSGAPSVAKLSQIRQLFHIKYEEDMT